MNPMVVSSSTADDIKSNLYLLIGLGNPGIDYRQTRHNIGFMVIDHLGIRLGIRLSRLQSRALIGNGIDDEYKIWLAKPQTYMNKSGKAVASLVRYHKIPFEQVLVIHDDIDLPLGTLRMRPSGGTGGQRGLASIIEELGGQDFPRLRIGIGRPPGRMDAADYVLENFLPNEKTAVEMILERATDAAISFYKNGMQQSMTTFNGNQDISE